MGGGGGGWGCTMTGLTLCECVKTREGGGGEGLHLDWPDEPLAVVPHKLQYPLHLRPVACVEAASIRNLPRLGFDCQR